MSEIIKPINPFAQLDEQIERITRARAEIYQLFTIPYFLLEQNELDMQWKNDKYKKTYDELGEFLDYLRKIRHSPAHGGKEEAE